MQQILLQIEDLIPKKNCYGLVYYVKCNDCEGNYIREAKQMLEKRYTQHNNDVQQRHRSTVFYEHGTERGHAFDFEGTGIVCFEENDTKRKIRETIEIIRHDTAVNFESNSTDTVLEMYTRSFIEKKNNENDSLLYSQDAPPSKK